MLTEEQILSNWEIFIELIGNISGERGQKLVAFYDKYADRFSVAPASGNDKFHNAFPGGYVAHVLNVYNFSEPMYVLWKSAGAYVKDFTLDELRFTTLNHDLGKFGTEGGEYYVPQTSDWHRDRGELYKHNDAIPFMKTSDRSLYILQQLGVQMSENEYMAIKLHDGLYEESNKSYLVSYSDAYRLQPHLAYILHQADLMASRIEYDNVNRKPFVTQKIEIDNSKMSKTTFSTASEIETDHKKLYKEAVYTGSKYAPKQESPKVKAVGKYAHLLNKK